MWGDLQFTEEWMLELYVGERVGALKGEQIEDSTRVSQGDSATYVKAGKCLKKSKRTRHTQGQESCVWMAQSA